GEGANFVIKRRFQARIDGYATASALSFFRQLLLREKGAYWTFIVHTGERTLVGGDGQGGRTLDSAILIRTAEIEGDGRLRIGVGSTIVRHSDPLGEAAESRAK
ncbi:chorismate-binding protein, partial [Pseudomonas aeruginosa]|uniref:chorismate-binding protein n=1 Tax=Pseudomonas aeruginosa TaxID=287 RepID=UPI002044E3BE